MLTRPAVVNASLYADGTWTGPSPSPSVSGPAVTSTTTANADLYWAKLTAPPRILDREGWGPGTADAGPALVGRLSCLRLCEADVVAEGVSEAAVDPVGTLGGFLGELHAPAAQRLVRLAAVVGAEDE